MIRRRPLERTFAGRACFRGGCTAAAAALVLQGCIVTAPKRPDQSFSDAEVERVYTVGYRNIHERYIDPINVRQLALNAIEGLGRIDRNLTVVTTEKEVELRTEGQIRAHYWLPDENDAEGWADLTTNLIETGRTLSLSLRDASTEQVYMATFEAVLDHLDGFSRYVSAPAAQATRASRVGFGGIGVRLEQHEHGVKIVEVYDDTPAHKAGLKAGDVITHVDDQPMKGVDREEILYRLRGLVGSRVKLRVEREDGPPFAVAIRRDLIVPQTVSSTVRDGIAHIKITSFNRRTASNLTTALHDIRSRSGRDVKGIILDLRNNPGGLLEQAVIVADMFLDHGLIVSTRGRHPLSSQKFDADTSDLAAGWPMVVLINGGSASASEIVASALQDQGRAVVVGSKSFGKGTVQNIIRLPNDSEIILTWSRIYTPAGYLLNGVGVLPTVCTSVNRGDTTALLKEVETGPARPTQAPTVEASTDGSTATGAAVAAQLCPSSMMVSDTDLEVARRLIQTPQLYEKAIRLGSSQLATR